jgi:hypothetical protein
MESTFSGVCSNEDFYLKQKSLIDLKPIPVFLQQHWCLKKSIDKVIERLQFVRETPLREDNINSGKVKIDGTNCMVVLGRNYSMILIHNGWHLISRDQLVMIHNKVTETVNCFLIGWLLSGVCWNEDFYLKQKSLIDFMRRKVNQLHNQAYELFKTFDGLATATILKEKDTFKNDGPIPNIITNLLRNKIITQLDKLELLRIFQGATYELIELSGVSKLLGHPDIDTPAGLNKLKIRVSKPNIVSVEKVAELLGVINMRYCETFYRNHRKWPIIDLEKTCNIGLRNCVLLGLWITHSTIIKKYGNVTSNDFIGLNIIQNHEFDDIPTQFPILKDTSISPTLSGLNLTRSDKRITERERRTLLFFLETVDPTLETLNYIKHYADRSPLALEYCVIKLTQKERDLKFDGRFFGSSPYVERARRCILESNVADVMDEYNLSQAMTLDELKKFSKMYTLSNLS